MANTQAINDLIKDRGLKKRYVAKALGLSPYGLARKINNENEFKANEIAQFCDLLGIESIEDRMSLFFADKVDLKSTNGG